MPTAVPPTICELHHTAYRVQDIRLAVEHWCQRLGARLEMPPTLISADDVLVAFLSFSGGRVELIQSVASAARSGPPGRPDHLCFLCSDFDERVARVHAERGMVVRAPVPSEAFGMRRMCFILYREMGLIELVER